MNLAIRVGDKALVVPLGHHVGHHVPMVVVVVVVVVVVGGKCAKKTG